MMVRSPSRSPSWLRRFSGYLGDDRGQVAGIEVLPFGFLVFVVGALLLANAWAVIDAKLAVTAAAREAARTYVEAPDESSALESAHRAAANALSGHGRTAEDLSITVVNTQGWGRCARVVIETESRVPAVGLPFIGGFGRSFQVAARHTEVVDPYRSGLPGEVDCVD